jgi:hypothetical protein
VRRANTLGARCDGRETVFIGDANPGCRPHLLGATQEVDDDTDRPDARGQPDAGGCRSSGASRHVRGHEVPRWAAAGPAPAGRNARVENGRLRFEDKKGRAVFTLPLAGAKAFVGAEKRTTAASIFRSTALMMVAVPLSVGEIDPMQAWSRDSRPILVVKLGSGGATLRWRGPAAQLSVLTDAINRAAQAADVLPSAD